MKLKTVLRDALFLNWALPVEALPELPSPLRYELHRVEGEDVVFASALLSRQFGLHRLSLPFFRLSYPQLHLRFCVLDGVRMPSFFVGTLLVPAWVAPATALLARQPSTGARFRFPEPAEEGDDHSWSWSVTNGTALEVEARFGSPPGGGRPDLGDWRQTVAYFLERERSYVQVGDRLRRLEAAVPEVEVSPVSAEVHDAALLAERYPGVLWPALHSAWLCHSMPLSFEFGTMPVPRLRRRAIPQAAASSRSRV
ncbi:MAG: hypothetical protein AAF481_17590 [Acidobacteriota bacterium]